MAQVSCVRDAHRLVQAIAMVDGAEDLVDDLPEIGEEVLAIAPRCEVSVVPKGSLGGASMKPLAIRVVSRITLSGPQACCSRARSTDSGESTCTPSCVPRATAP